MVSAAVAVAMLAQLASITAVGLSSSPENLDAVTITTPQAVQSLLPVVAFGALLTAVTTIYRQLQRNVAATGRPGTEVAFGIACAAAGVLELIFSFVRPAAGGVGAAAAQLLPAAAMATFFLSMTLLFVAVAHVRARGGGLAGEGPFQILVKAVVGATAVLVGLMALMAL